jgi:hypothetical protein
VERPGQEEEVPDDTLVRQRVVLTSYRLPADWHWDVARIAKEA